MFRILYVLFLLLITPSCKGSQTPVSGVLRISFPIYPSTFDPRKSGDFTSATIICLLYEGLTKSAPDGQQELAIAENIEVSKDQKTYLFHLRKTFWSDGSPVTAFDFERTWKQSLDPDFPSLCAYLFYPILNAEKACRGIKSIDEVGICALDEWTLEVQLERPTPYFESLTSFPSFFPVPQHRLAEIDQPAFSPHFVVNGPFLVEKISSQSSIILRKNPTYWNPSATRLEGISIAILPHETTALEMFQREELDWIGGSLSPIPPDALSFLLEKLEFHPIAASTFCSFNMENPRFSNFHIRKAFSLAIDREEIAREILPLHQTPATRCIPPSLDRGKNRNIFPIFHPQEAKEHLAKGIEELKTPLSSITLHYRTGPIDGRIAQVLQQKWEKVLGIKVHLQQSDFKTHKDTLHLRNYEVVLANWIAQYQDPINILERFKDRLNAKNYPGWQDPEFSFLLDLAQKAIDPKDRSLLLERAEELLAHSLPIIPLYHWRNASLSHPRVKNLQTTPGGVVLFERCWIADNP